MPQETRREPSWWDALAGSPPDEATTNPKKGLSLLSGAFGPGKLTLKLDPERIEWLLSPADIEADELPTISEFPNIGALPEALEIFSNNVAAKWLRENPIPTARLAFGAVLHLPQPSRRAGYERFPDYVPVGIDPESSDFLFQINLPTSSRVVQGLQLNRLTKWAALRMGFVLVHHSVAQQRVLRTEAAERAQAIRLELDVNTVPSGSELPGAAIGAVYRELTEAATAIVANGIIKPT